MCHLTLATPSPTSMISYAMRARDAKLLYNICVCIFINILTVEYILSLFVNVCELNCLLSFVNVRVLLKLMLIPFVTIVEFVSYYNRNIR